MSLHDAAANALIGERIVRLACRFDQVEGWLNMDQGFALHELARLGDQEGAVVEIGSFKGRSTCWLASGNKVGKVYAVDTFMGSVEHAKGAQYEVPEVAGGQSTFPTFERNLKGLFLWDRVQPIVSESVPAAKAWDRGPIRLLFIDADHSYAGASADFNAWKVHLAPRAVVAFHDIGEFPGVTMFYHDLISDGGHTELFSVGSLRAIQGRQP